MKRTSIEIFLPGGERLNYSPVEILRTGGAERLPEFPLVKFRATDRREVVSVEGLPFIIRETEE